MQSNGETIEATPAQKQLLELVKGPEAKDYAMSLKVVHINGTYFTEEAMLSPKDSFYVSLLLDCLQDLAFEHLQKPKQ